MIVNKQIKITWEKIKSKNMFLKVTSDKVELLNKNEKCSIKINIKNSIVYSESFLRDYYKQQTSEQIALF